MAFVFRAYASLLQRRPLVGAMCTSMVLHGAGDVGAQYLTMRGVLVAKREEEDQTAKWWQQIQWGRTLRFCVCGALFHGPFVHSSFVASDRLLGPTVSLLAAVKKMVLNQTVFAPVYLGIFFPFMGLLEGRDWIGCMEKTQNGFRAALIGHCTVWPAALIVMFRFVPAHMRLLFANSVALGWNCVLSIVNSTSTQEEVSLTTVIGRTTRDS